MAGKFFMVNDILYQESEVRIGETETWEADRDTREHAKNVCADMKPFEIAQLTGTLFCVSGFGGEVEKIFHVKDGK